MDTSQTVAHLGLCAGYGGIELGLKRAIPSLRTVALCEIEAFAIANLVSKMEAGLMDPAPIWPDLKTFPWAAFRDRVDILTGGYPCQPFSAAGQRRGKDDPRHLWPYIADGIRLLRPRCCFFENVEGHISLGLSDVIEDLAGMGYRTTWGIFSASEVGAPHQRKRVFIMAYSSARGKLARSWSDSVLCGKRGESSGQLPIQQTGGENIYSERHIRHNSDDGGDSSKLALASGLGGAAGLSGPFPRHERQPRESDDGGDQRMANTECGRLIAGRNDAGQSQGSQSEHCSAWPSRPGEQQYGWEPPRVVGNTESEQDRGLQQPGVQADAASAGHDMADSSFIGSDRRPDGSCGWSWESGEAGVNATGSGSKGDGMRQAEPPLGGDTDGPAGGMDYAELCVTCDNRTDELRLLGNGVVPATAERAFRILMQELDIAHPVS